MSTIWYTKGLRNTINAIEMIKEDPAGQGIRIIASHVDPEHPVLQLADVGLVEPGEVEDAEYAQWVLETAKREQVDLVIAQRRPAALFPFLDAFDRAGIKVSLPGHPMVLERLDRKDLFTQDMVAMGIPVAATAAFDDVESFDAACAQLQDDPRVLAHGLCVKPVRGIYGSGFRILRAGDEFERMMKIANLEMDPELFRSILAKTEAPRKMLLMSLLPGVERSVDFIAHEGVFVTGVARRKLGKVQVLETEGPSIDMAKRLAAAYKLNGVCNLQTKEADGVPHVLEINPRMSGGMVMACMSGVKLPLWHVLLSLNLAKIEDVPAPVGNVRVGRKDITFAE